MQTLEQSLRCPLCGAEMKEVNGKYGLFYGCVNYPRCKGTRKHTGPVKREVQKDVKPNKYQTAIFQEVQKGTGHTVCNAVAGSGKTWTLEHAARLLPRDLDIIYVVFNAPVREEAKGKMPPWCPVVTYHQLGLAAVTAYLGHRPKIDGNKVNTTIKSLIQENWDADKHLISPVHKLVGMLKNFLMEATYENMSWIVNRFGIETNESEARIFQLAVLTLRESNRLTDVIDFDDMIYFPHLFAIKVKQYDFMLIDEIQDTNKAQLELALRSIKHNGRILGVGDISQAIYGWRGADTEAIPTIIKKLEAKTLPLSVTYRCPLLHVQLVNKLFPDIPFESAPNAKDGEISSVSEDRMLGEVKDGDMVLCRTNAPLVRPAFSLIRRGIKAVIRGRDIGTGLIDLIDKMKSTRLNDLLAELNEYKEKEVSKLLKAEKNTQAQMLEDKVETIFALSDGVNSVTDVKLRIEEVFSDDKEGIVFSTVHRAKGLEAENVYILRPDLLPHPMARQDWEREQERNIAYVAYTRSKNRLAFVGVIPEGFGGWDDKE
jgi:DNA helicase-2/ATP-dependent DNA helicase PcrA